MSTRTQECTPPPQSHHDVVERGLSRRILRFAAATFSPFLIACGAAQENQDDKPDRFAGAAPSAAQIAAAIDNQRASFANPAPAQGQARNAHQFTFEGLMVDHIPLAAFQGEILLIVNTASRCGFTPQYRALQSLHEEYAGSGFSVLGVPSNDFGGQEPGSAEEIREFCEINYGVTFPLAAKTPVSGANAHEFYAWAAAEYGADAIPRWNFHKILIDQHGAVVGAFPSSVAPDSEAIRTEIERLF